MTVTSNSSLPRGGSRRCLAKNLLLFFAYYSYLWC